MANVLTTVFKFKRGTAQRWIEVNPILADGEPGYEYDTNKLKVGNGVSKWTELPYFQQSEIIAYEKFSDLPNIGNSETLYRVLDSKLLYQWNEDLKTYEALGGSGSFDPSTITLINGGKANG